MEIGELGAEGVIEVRYVSKTAIKRHVENLESDHLPGARGGLPFPGLLIFSCISGSKSTSQ
jgi:hypothetical protein